MILVKRPEEMLLREVAVFINDSGKPNLVYRDLAGNVHNLTSDETRIDKIQELITAIHTERV